MSEPSPAEFKETIQELTAYRDRLHKEVITVAKKLQMSPKKITITLEEHSEIKQINSILKQLKVQLQKGEIS